FWPSRVRISCGSPSASSGSVVDELPRLVERGIDQLSDFWVEVRIPCHRHQLLPLHVSFPISRGGVAVQRAIRCCAAKICCSAQRSPSFSRVLKTAQEGPLSLFRDPAPRPAPVSPFAGK